MNQINFYLFDLDGTLIDTRIYAVIYLEILEMVKKRLNLSDEELEAKAKGFGLKKNKFKRWDSGDLCRELDLLDEYYNLSATGRNSLRYFMNKHFFNKTDIKNIPNVKDAYGASVGQQVVTYKNFSKTSFIFGALLHG